PLLSKPGRGFAMQRLWTILLIGGCFPLLARGGARADDATVATLIEQLRTGDRLQRQDAAEALGKIGPAAEAAVPVLTDALRQQSLARPAARALVANGRKAWPPVLKMFHKYENQWQRAAAEEALQGSPLWPSLELLKYHSADDKDSYR